jgi:hypothetical protein
MMMIPMAVLALALSAFSPGPPPHNPRDPVANFEYAWSRPGGNWAQVSAKHVDRDAVHRVYRVQVTPTTTGEELWSVLLEKVSTLNDAHACVQDGRHRQRPPASPTAGQGQMAPPAEGKQAPTLTGRVIDGSSSRPIAGAVVQVGEKRAVTDAEGRFALDVPSGEARVNVAAEGYLSDEVRVTIGSAPVAVEILLLTKTRLNEVVTVTGTSVPASPPPVTIVGSPLEVRNVAGAWENIFKTLQDAARRQRGDRLRQPHIRAGRRS